MRLRIGLLAIALSIGSAVQSAAEVQLTIRDGRVSLTATGATVREILAEWARVGQTTIVNADKVSGAPMTLQLTDEPEDRALETILRSVSGYVAAPRPMAAASVSRYDRIVVMPARPGPRPIFSSPPATSPAPAPQVFRPPQAMPDQPFQPMPIEVDQDAPFPRPAGAPGDGSSPRGPVFNSFPPLPDPAEPETAPSQASPSFAFPAPGRGGPTGVSVPGMIVQPPPPPAGTQPPPQ
jgi:hypothetical protein